MSIFQDKYEKKMCVVKCLIKTFCLNVGEFIDYYDHSEPILQLSLFIAKILQFGLPLKAFMSFF